MKEKYNIEINYYKIKRNDTKKINLKLKII